MRISFPLFRLSLAAALLFFCATSVLSSQVAAVPGVESPAPFADSYAPNSNSSSRSASNLPDAPGFSSSAPADYAAPVQRGGEPWEGEKQYGPLSRVGFGADVSPLGVGIKSATILTRYLDARLLINFLNYTSGEFEVSGIRTDATLHLFTAGAALDCYPRNSIWRLSTGLMMHNGNHFSASGEAAPGQSFTVDGEKFYSANANAVTGVTPVNGSGVLGLNTRQPEFFLSGGFGRFVPHSERHWSFPSELGVIFMGSPTVDLTTSGWVCKNTEPGSCSDVSSATPVATQFNNALQAQLTKWRQSLSSFRVYPMFSYSVVYSFDVP